MVARWIREKLQQGLEAALGGDDDDEDDDDEDGKLGRLRTIFSLGCASNTNGAVLQMTRRIRRRWPSSTTGWP